MSSADKGGQRAKRPNRATRDAARYILETMDPDVRKRIADKATEDRIPFSEALQLLEPDLWRKMEAQAATYPDWW